MNVENVGLTIQTGPTASVFEAMPDPIFLKVGKLGELVTLHRFAEAE
ncbi:hypothetical protein [Sphingopyxis yananensis]|nr:hypothetical protein [Sphingopyxis yananensis]MCC2601604.1 hypothetical protein [Sphingopyxis yananensis]